MSGADTMNDRRCEKFPAAQLPLSFTGRCYACDAVLEAPETREGQLCCICLYVYPHCKRCDASLFSLRLDAMLGYSPNTEGDNNDDAFAFIGWTCRTCAKTGHQARTALGARLAVLEMNFTGNYSK